MVKRSVSLIDSAVERMVNIIRQLSTIATTERLPLQQVGVQQLLEDTVKRFRAEFKIDTPVTITNLTPANFRFRTNAETLESIIGKLLINSFEALPQGTNPVGKVEIVASLEPQPDDNPQLLIQVLDRGIGIDPALADNLFDPFISSKTAVGRGLGLTMARHSIRNLSGDLQLAPRPNGGTSALLYHPVG
jgi:C4-dicarboxylate-specific signal transduction histidine kinase